MKIYQIIDSWGSFEDYTEDVCGTFVSKNKARRNLELLVKAENKKRSQNEKCRHCPMMQYDNLSKLEIEKIKNRCEHSDIKHDDDGYVYCNSGYASYDTDKEYEIRTFDVIE